LHREQLHDRRRAARRPVARLAHPRRRGAGRLRRPRLDDARAAARHRRPPARRRPRPGRRRAAAAPARGRRRAAEADPARRQSDRARLVRGAGMTTAELVARLVAVDSTNPDLVPGGAGEAGVAVVIAEHMAGLGLEVDLWDAAPGRPNVVGRLPGTGGGRSLMFCGHTDVVGGVPGACVIDEEWQSVGAQALVERYGADAAVLPEQSDLDVIFAHGGFAWYDVTSRGVEAAGGRPERGRDAITLAGPVLTGIAELERELTARETPEWGRPSVHASTIRGGRDYPSYPGEC